MEKLTNIYFDVIEYDNELGNTCLKLNIKGKNMNYIIINTIRRAVLTYIPIYAFTDFNFTINESVFNNNYIKLRLSNMAVWGILNKIDKYTTDNKIINPNNSKNIYELPIDDDIDLENETKINTSSLNQLTMYIDYINKEKNIITLTTDNAKFYYAEKNIESPYKVPIPIIKLHPGQNINFSTITNLGTEKMNSIYSAVSVCYYIEKNDNEYEFILESRGQLTEFRIIEVALINLINSIENLTKIIPTDSSKDIIGEIIINNENNTIGNLLSYGMQIHKHVKYAGYNIPHLLEDKVKIHYELINDKIKIKDVLNDVIIYFIELFKEIIKLNKDCMNHNLLDKEIIVNKKKSSKKIIK